MAFLREPTLWDGVFLTRHHQDEIFSNIVTDHPAVSNEDDVGKFLVFIFNIYMTIITN